VISDLSCYVCLKTFSRKDALRTHIRDIHENVGKTFPCPYCPNISRSESGRKMHLHNFHRDNHHYNQQQPY
jgi:uncharacterized Zn-finger protein